MLSHHGSTASCASTINYRVASHDDFWIYTPVLHFEPKRAKIKLDKENRSVHIGPTSKYKIEVNGSDQINGGAIKLHVRADLERGFEWEPKMDKDNVPPPPPPALEPPHRIESCRFYPSGGYLAHVGVVSCCVQPMPRLKIWKKPVGAE